MSQAAGGFSSAAQEAERCDNFSLIADDLRSANHSEIFI
jgi:hypothetical protein